MSEPVTDTLTVRLEHDDGATVHASVDKIVFSHDGKEYCLAIRHDRLELWVRMGDLDIRPLHHNAIAIGRAPGDVGPQLSQAVSRFVAAEAEADRLRAILATHVDHTNPQCPIGAALTGDSK